MLKPQKVSGASFAAAEATAKSLNSESKTPRETETAVGEHPEGHKRGGYVPVCVAGSARVYWDENACSWFPYDDEAFE